MAKRSIQTKPIDWPKILRSLEIEHLWQALLLAPGGCLDLRAPMTRWSDLPRGQPIFLSGTLDEIEFQDRDGAPTTSPFPVRAKIIWRDADGVLLPMRLFGGAKDWKSISLGSSVLFAGRIVDFHGRPQVQFDAFIPEYGFVLPQYAGVPGLVSGADLRRLIRKALRDGAAFTECARSIADAPGAVDALRDLGYVDAAELLRHLHQPQTPEECRRAIRAARTLSLRALKSSVRRDFGAASPVAGFADAMRAAAREWPQPPSAAQRSALRQMASILGGGRATRTLLLGDVGSGKTRVFATPVAAFARAGRRCAVLAPNAPVARQILDQIRGLWPDLSVGLCTASLRETDARVLVGTTALIPQIDTLGERLALVVVDEQHKFSVDQRDLPVDHVIEASATPIPRSLALAEAGGWNLVTIDQSAIRRNLVSHMVDHTGRAQLQGMMLGHLRAGRRIVYVYPVVKSDADDSVIRAHERLNAHFRSVGGALLLHGRMPESRKLETVAAFREGRSPVLVCTTAVETGLDVPGIGLLVVMDPDRYGTSQLHQLRGRLARDGGDGDFVMYLGKRQPGPRTLERLRAVAECVDGLDLARRDLDARGIGSLLGTRQSGRARTLFLRDKVGLDDLRAV